jgi:A/G-specific adenine glycosylase
MSKTLVNGFSKKLITWHIAYGREGLPWQGVKDPYAVWVSEIMLQQTQVATVLERYPRFMKRFPNVQVLAAAPIDDVLAEWAGLGYYSRARNLHACAQQVMNNFSGRFPQDPLLLEQLKGIGRSTAGAIAAFAFEGRAPILDANVKRVLARLFGIEEAIQEKKTNDRLWSLSEQLLPLATHDMPLYTQALMDFGATWCTSRKPACLTEGRKCPFAKECQANLSNLVLELPRKSPKAKSPEFDCDMMLMRCGNSVLLQKRPDTAIWGGLWSLPESVWRPRLHQEQLKSNLSAHELFQLTAPQEDWSSISKFSLDVKCGKQIKHIFTHRRLWMQIWQLAVPAEFKLGHQNMRWVSLHELGKYGLPQPIKLVLQGVNLVRDDEKEN